MKNQKSILGFFQKSSPSTPSGKQNTEPASSPAQRASERRAEGRTNGSSKTSKSTVRTSQDLTPMLSSDLIDVDEDESLNKVGDIELEIG
jgi:DNA mismatch repair protein MSH6